jgi:hypothetical protein
MNNNNNPDNSNESNSRTSMENTLIELYNDFNHILNLNSAEFNYNYYNFFYIYNIYINMYSDESANTILQIFDEYNSLLTDSIELQINVENISPGAILERNRIKFTVIEKNSHEYTDHDCCSICLHELQQSQESQKQQEEFIKTNCNHIFHLQCLSTWVNQNKKTCPICRNAMVE